MIALLSAAVAISRDYQDSWILEGLEVPFAVFMVTYLVYFSAEKNPIWLIAFALIFRFTVLSLPNLKYAWYQGLAIDQHRHYRLTQDIYDQGRIRTGDLYSGTPMMHLSFVLYSIITGLPAIDSFKYFPILAWSAFPIVTYLVISNIAPENSSIQKFALFASSVPAKPPISYLVIGTLFGPLLTFLILSQLTKMTHKNDRRYLIIIVVYTFALAATHSFSSIALSILLFVTYFLLQTLRRIGFISTLSHAKLSFSTLMIIMLISMAWFSLTATTFYVSIRSLGVHMGLIESPTVVLPGFFISRFFEIGLLNGLKVILVFHGADLLLILLTLTGFAFIYRKLRMRGEWELMLLSSYLVSLALFFTFGYVFGIGMHWYDRAIRLLLVVSPIFAGISLHYLEAKMHNKMLPILFMSLLMLLSTVELYRFQPLIPAASSFSSDLPNDEPLVYVNGVNTVYQRSMIAHAERFFPQDVKIASDTITKNQLLGLTSINFSRAHTRYYPLSKEEPREFDYFLIHLPGKSGGFEDQAETRTRSLILSAIYNASYNILYTNGESYILGVSQKS